MNIEIMLWIGKIFSAMILLFIISVIVQLTILLFKGRKVFLNLIQLLEEHQRQMQDLAKENKISIKKDENEPRNIEIKILSESTETTKQRRSNTLQSKGSRPNMRAPESH